jgi:hypothetical protein
MKRPATPKPPNEPTIGPGDAPQEEPDVHAEGSISVHPRVPAAKIHQLLRPNAPEILNGTDAERYK